MGVGAGTLDSMHSSKISISMGIGRGGGVCTGAVGSKHLSNSSSSLGPTGEAVTAATSQHARRLVDDPGHGTNCGGD